MDERKLASKHDYDLSLMRLLIEVQNQKNSVIIFYRLLVNGEKVRTKPFRSDIMCFILTLRLQR